jgi:glutamyl-tRNA synthetase
MLDVIQSKSEESETEIATSQTPRNDIDVNYISMVINLIKERATFVTDFWDLGHFFFETPSNLDEKAVKKAWKEESPELMKELITIISSTEDYTVETLQTNIKGWITSNEIGFGKVMMPLRLALVGALQGPDVFDIMYLIGKDESMRRIDNLINTLS